MSWFESENFLIFLDNLSPYHVLFDLISLAAFVITLLYCWKVSNLVPTPIVSESLGSASDEDLSEYTGMDHSSATTLRAKSLMDQVSASLSLNELEQEQKVVKMQVEQIYELLKQQEEKFNVTSLDQVREQLSLYR